MGSSSCSHNLLNITITVILLFFVYCNKEIVMADARNISDHEATAIDDHDHDHVNDDDHEEYNHSFDDNYYISWAEDHVFSQHQGNLIQLNFDRNSGAAISSKNRYGSGYFHLRLKVPGRHSAGVVTAFYMTSHGDGHDEVDFEFLGNENGRPLSLQTNVFVNGIGGREEATNLWFDPSADFHTYKILWNQHQLVFYVDNTPIRVFRNKTEFGAGYPTRPMQIEASIWDASGWAYGGHLHIHWRFAPFKALFRGFRINDGCVSNTATYSESCNSDEFWWNREDRWTLNAREQRLLQDARTHMTYNYCTDNLRYPTPPPECLH